MADPQPEQRSSPEPTPSATLLLVRDSPRGLEVLMVERHHRIDFAPGALVFPGGKVDPGDADPRLRRRCRGAGDFDPQALATRVAAIREAFEEGGVLLAGERERPGLVGAARLREIAARHRRALHAGETSLLGVVEEEDLELACDAPVPFAHWITPEASPRRFDTHFFLVEAPPDQVAVHDGSESVDSLWIAPPRAIREQAAGRLTIVFPTLLQLRKLAPSQSVREALAAARSSPVVTVLPRVVQGEAGPVLRIPPDAGYDVVEAPLSELFEGGRARSS